MFEMYFSQTIDTPQLCDAIAKHLFLRREDIGVVPLTLIDTLPTALVVEDIGGDFPFAVTIHTDLTWLQISEVELAQKLSTTLKTECLIAEDCENPYRWLHVCEKQTQSVLVDPHLFDGQSILKISPDSPARLFF